MPKIQIKKGAKNCVKHNLSHSHITTMDFKMIKPTLCLPLVPSDKITCHLMSTVRLAPMDVPTYGDIRLVHRAFFVPARIIQPHFNDIMSDHSFFDGNDWIKSSEFMILDTSSQSWGDDGSDDHTAFIQSGCAVVVTNSSQTHFDYYIKNGSSTKYRALTQKGRRLVDLLMSLGYPKDLFWNLTYKDMRISALPLMAFVRVYLDYFIPSQYPEKLANLETEKEY